MLYCELRLDMHHNDNDDAVVDDYDDDEYRLARSKCIPLHLRRLAYSHLPRSGYSYGSCNEGAAH